MLLADPSEHPGALTVAELSNQLLPLQLQRIHNIHEAQPLIVPMIPMCEKVFENRRHGQGREQLAIGNWQWARINADAKARQTKPSLVAASRYRSRSNNWPQAHTNFTKRTQPRAIRITQ
jgi:hypothetical protein